jgi:hypothetical protein
MDATALEGGCILGGILEEHISICNLDSERIQLQLALLT